MDQHLHQNWGSFVKSAEIWYEAYELQHHKATELLAFVISTRDRIHEGEKPNQLPIAYALKGYSLTGETLWKLINDVRNKCKEYGIMVLADCTDGQWVKITNRSENAKPLTKIQFQKDCWHAVCKKSKQVLLQNLVDYSVIDEEVLKIVETCMFVWPHSPLETWVYITRYLKMVKGKSN